MIKFNVNKFHSVYCYILRVTNDSVYVVSRRNGQPYNPDKSSTFTYNGHTVNRVKIGSSASFTFRKNNSITTYAKPRLASINYYEDSVISLEIQLLNQYLNDYQKAENWQSPFSKTVAKFESEKIIPEGKEAYFNGRDVFWVYDNALSDFNTSIEPTGISLNNKNYRIVQVEYINALNMSGSYSRRVVGALAKKAESSKVSTDEGLKKIYTDFIEEIEGKVSLRTSIGAVLVYYPNPEDRSVFSCSPVLSEKTAAGRNISPVNAMVHYINKDSFFPNIHFVILAATAIGGMYGNEAVEFLDIPKIVEETGEVCLSNLSDGYKRRYCVGISSQSVIAWLLGFIYRETDVNKVAKLCTLFRSCISGGIVSSDLNSKIFQDGVNNIELINPASFYEKWEKQNKAREAELLNVMLNSESA